MPALEMINVMTDQKTAGANAVLSGKISTNSSKSGLPTDFLKMIQKTMAEYQHSNQNQKPNQNQGPNRNHREEKLVTGSDANGHAQIISNKKKQPPQDNGKSINVVGNASPGETVIKSGDEKGNDEQKEAIVAPLFTAPVTMDKIITTLTAAAGDNKKAKADIALQKVGKRELVNEKDMPLYTTANEVGKNHKDNIASLVKNNHLPTEADVKTIPEMKNQLVKDLEDQGLSPEEIKVVLKAVEAPLKKINIADQSQGTKIEPEMKNQLVKDLEDQGLSPEEIKVVLKAVEKQSVEFAIADQSQGTKIEPETKNKLVKALEGKSTPADVIAGILKELDPVVVDKASVEQPAVQQDMKELDQIITKKSPEAKEVPTRMFHAHVETASPSFKQAAAAILENKGFSVQDIKDILNAVDQTMVVGVKAGAEHRSDKAVFIQQSFFHKEFMKEAAVDRKNIHADIYKKEASLEDFRQKAAEARVIINPLEKQTVKDGQPRETVGKLENTGRSEKKDVFAGVMKGTENKKTIGSDKEKESQSAGKVITSTAKDDQGKLIKTAGDVYAKTNHPNHEDISLGEDREQSPLSADILKMASKGAEFQPVKATMDTSKSIFQSVVDQIQDGFSIAQNKENGQVRLTLKPEIMGHLDMQIAVRNETVQIMMTVENEKVHQAMNAHIDDLKTSLQNQGLKIDKIEITLQYQPDQERTFYQDQAKSQFNNPGQNSHQERMANQKLSFGDDHYPLRGQEIIQKQSITEGVSIFA